MISSKRLVLRPFTLEDKEFLFNLNNDPDVNIYRTHKTVDMAYCIQSIEDWKDKYGEGLLNVYLVELNNTKEAIGLFALFGNQDEIEVGYRFLPEHWGQGYCKESLEVISKLYFELYPDDSIMAETHPDNRRSIDFLLKNNFVKREIDLDNRGKIFYLHNKRN